ncbi:hypothetical protein KCTC32516_00282 [Polaribacter huanghezhanensis]|nr:hypothetical protein KCTC32516_00282 [Polaribacter huanghezhanensis]
MSVRVNLRGTNKFVSRTMRLLDTNFFYLDPVRYDRKSLEVTKRIKYDYTG